MSLALCVGSGSLWAQAPETATESPTLNGLTRPAIAPDAAVSAEQWLARMNHALSTSKYSGTFVFLRDGQLDALRIEHVPVADDAQQRLRLYSMSGERVEAITDNHALRIAADSGTSQWPDPLQPASSVIQPKRPPATLYDVVLGTQDRIAGRQAQVVDIRPRDGFRYGYRFWLDMRSALLLKSLTIGSDGRAIEQLMFTSLETEADMPSDDAGLVSAEEHSESQVQRESQHDARSTPASALWQVLDAPDGFAPQLITGGDGTHLLFSDGLARVSVYIEPLIAAKPTLSGLVSRGALNAYGRVAQGQQIIAIGEAPATTIERFAQGVVSAARGAPVHP